eukprot:1835953-Lingulodinium_polyedra.AAC.1
MAAGAHSRGQATMAMGKRRPSAQRRAIRSNRCLPRLWPGSECPEPWAGPPAGPRFPNGGRALRPLGPPDCPSAL